MAETCVWRRALVVVLAAAAAQAPPGARAGDDVIIDALADELARSMTLKLEDVGAPYFVEYAVTDTASHRMSATCGAIVTSDESRGRWLVSQVRVGYYDLDNTNFGGADPGIGRAGRGRGRGPGPGRVGGGSAALPTDDSYPAIRQAAWLATDAAYKQAVEDLAAKRAYMEDRRMPDQPDDFSRVDPLVRMEPRAVLSLDAPAWEAHLRQISRRLLEHTHLSDSDASIVASADNRYLVNSEGSRVRTGSTSVTLTVSAQLQADDGEALSDRLVYDAVTPEGLPPVQRVLDDLDEMARRLAAKASAPILEDYVGPVLFDGTTAPQLIHALLARGLAGQREPVGGGRRRFEATENLEKYLGKRILPQSFDVYDDPREPRFGDEMLVGHYTVDDEGVPARRVDLVVDGRLVAMVMSRVPTTRFAESNGHGRGAGGQTRAAVGCLYVQADGGLDPDGLTKALTQAAAERELEYGIRITSIGRTPSARALAARFPGAAAALASFGAAGGGAGLGDPIAIYKVYTDGREELVRGCEFGDLDVEQLEDIIAGGAGARVFNAGRGAAAASVIAPALLLEDVQILTIEEERERPPIVTAPHRRAGAG
jgi:hypothetical protein